MKPKPDPSPKKSGPTHPYKKYSPHMEVASAAAITVFKVEGNLIE
jgi:hypothetical protein